MCIGICRSTNLENPNLATSQLFSLFAASRLDSFSHVIPYCVSMCQKNRVAVVFVLLATFIEFKTFRFAWSLPTPGRKHIYKRCGQTARFRNVVATHKKSLPGGGATIFTDEAEG